MGICFKFLRKGSYEFSSSGTINYQGNKQDPSFHPFGGPCSSPGLSFPGYERQCWAAVVLPWLASQSGRTDFLGSVGSLPVITVS